MIKVIWFSLDRFGKIIASLTAVVVLALLLAAFVRVVFYTHVELHEVGYLFDSRTGQTTVLNRTGYIGQWPVVQSVKVVDTRPMQVCISSIQRVLNCKLVQFDTAGLMQFLGWHGRDNYTNSGTREMPSDFNEIMKAYAYDSKGRTFPFLKILDEIK